MIMTFHNTRDLEPLLLNVLATTPVVAISGMRQAGKSTLLTRQGGLAKRRYVSLDDFSHLEEARRDPERFLTSAPALTIDEAHRCPELFPVINTLVDQNRRPGRFLLSGSVKLMHLKSLTESLADKVVYLELQPFSAREITNRTTPPPFLLNLLAGSPLSSLPPTVSSISPEAIHRGGFPALSLRAETDASLWFKGYEQIYLEKDIRSLSQIGDLLAFRRLLQLVALRSAQVLNISDLARDAKLNAATTSRYLDLMETSYVLYRLPPYLKNRAARLIKSPKAYLADSGLAAHLAFPSAGLSDPLYGPLLETWVAQNLRSIISSWAPEGGLYYWNVQGRHEVDFIFELHQETLALDVISRNNWNDNDLSSLRSFLKQTPNCKAGILAHTGTVSVALGDRLWALPLELLLS